MTSSQFRVNDDLKPPLKRSKKPSRCDKLSSEQGKQVLEVAMEVMREGLHDEGRVEAQGFLVIERTRWVVRVRL